MSKKIISDYNHTAATSKILSNGAILNTDQNVKYYNCILTVIRWPRLFSNPYVAHCFHMGDI